MALPALMRHVHFRDMKAGLYHPGLSDKESCPWPIHRGKQCKQLSEVTELGISPGARPLPQRSPWS